MADKSFEARLASVAARDAQKAQPQTQPQRPQSATRREKLAHALAHLERGGVRGSYAYGKRVLTA